MAAIDLPDINVWIALRAPDHEHRTRAERYWRQEAAPRLAFCTVTMVGLVRVSCSAPLFAGQPLDPETAWAAVQGWMAFNEVVTMREPDGCLAKLDSLVTSGYVTRRTWTDSYLTAFAMSSGLRLVSFDADFRRCPDLDLLHLSP